MRKIIHIDMDCFFAAVEIRDNPALKNKPVAVGGSSYQRGVISTCNYIARKYGIHSAMSTTRAYKLCPELIVLKGDMQKYKQSSDEIRQIFFEYTNLVEPLSLDEAFLDVTNCKQQKGSATWIAKEIRKKIFLKTALIASAGVAPNKFLAKIASDLNKPNGQFVILPEEVDDFVRNLNIEKIMGVGKVTARKMHRLGIKTCKDLQILSQQQLMKYFGKFGLRLSELSFGKDNREVCTKRERKSVSVEKTYANDLNSLDEGKQEINKLFDRLQNRIKKNETKNIRKQFCKIKFNDFTQITIEKTINSKIIQKEIYKNLFEKGYLKENKPFRLIGLGIKFMNCKTNCQFSLLDID
jgi:DNA polymerase-4